ncbi:MAG TPA: ABC transporter ATP-binding protein, partial [Savagea sp.]
QQKVEVIKDVSFEINAGEIVAVVGRSGSGKSTLLHLIAGFLQPDQGKILIQKNDLTVMNEEQLASFRLEHVGFIFQNFQLMPGLNAQQNIEFPLILAGVSLEERTKRVEEMLQLVGLQEVARHYPNELSGGQQQRVGIARALINRPSLILADEPTGSLDSETEQEILQLIRDLNQTHHLTFVMITHDDAVAQMADRMYTMHDGVLSGGERHDI